MHPAKKKRIIRYAAIGVLAVVFIALYFWAGDKGNKIRVLTDSSLSASKVKVELGIYGKDSGSDLALTQMGLDKFIYNKMPRNGFETVCGENDFYVTYDNKYYAVFRHLIPNDFYDGIPDPHVYMLALFWEEGKIMLYVQIKGEYEQAFACEMLPIASASRNRWGKPIERYDNREAADGKASVAAFATRVDSSGNYIIPKDLTRFFEAAFQRNFDTVSASGDTWLFYKTDIGKLKITEGKIAACDPFTYNDHRPFTAGFPKGAFPVELAIARINKDERVAFARVKFAESEPVSWTLAVTAGQDTSTLSADEIFGYGVDAGMAAFMDAPGSKEFLHFMRGERDAANILIKEMENSSRPTRSWLMWEMNNRNVALFSTGWGDGFYASYIGYDEKGNICRLVTDFRLMD